MIGSGIASDVAVATFLFCCSCVRIAGELDSTAQMSNNYIMATCQVPFPFLVLKIIAWLQNLSLFGRENYCLAPHSQSY